VEENFFNLYITACCIARAVQKLLHTAAESQVFEVTAALVQAGIELAVQDLPSYKVLKQQTSNCYFKNNHTTAEEPPEERAASKNAKNKGLLSSTKEV